MVSPIDGPRAATSRGRSAARKGLVIASCAVFAAASMVSGAAAAEPVDTLLRVRVTDAAGLPLAGRPVLATVHWTSKDDFVRYGRMRGRLLRTDANGDIAVAMKLDRAQRAAVRRNGDWANITVVAFDAAGRPSSQATTSRYLGTRPKELARARSMPHPNVVRLVDRASAGGAEAKPAASEALTSCNYYWEEDGFANRYAQVGELHVDYDVPYARFTYGRTADTTFDVASRAGFGPWGISGGVHIANSLEAAVYADAGGQTNYHWALRTQFRFVSVKLFKDCLGGPYRAWTGSQYVAAVEWTGNGMTLSNPLTQLPRTSGSTAMYGPNTGWSRASNTLVKWSATVSPFGASIGAQSGASSNVEIDYAFGSRPMHYLYGDTGLPSVAKRVFQDTP